MDKRATIIAAVLILTAIILGAFGAHALKELISEKKLLSFETGVRYQMYMGIALLTTGLWNNGKIKLIWFNRLLVTGLLLFSASIYLLALEEVMGTELKFLGPVTPIGGMLMISSWVVFIVKVLRTKID